MGLEQHVRDGDLVLQVRPLAAVTRILVGADIVPGPAGGLYTCVTIDYRWYIRRLLACGAILAI